MSDVAVVARGIVSALGDGEGALGPLSVGEPAPRAVTRDHELAAAGLVRPFAARVASLPEGRDRATTLLERAFASCAAELDAALPEWRALRVGAAIGTSSGGMRSFERVSDDVSGGDAASIARIVAASYAGPWIDTARPMAFEPASLVLGACASGTLAMGLARAWLLDDRCDVALAGGFDAVSSFVAAGFESLRATCGASGPRPFREGRDGLALGEGAAILALVRAPLARRSVRLHGWVSGFGASCDAAHLTAPDAGGGGLARAARAALVEAGEPAVDLVSAHGTATPQNDGAEASAIVTILGESARTVPVCSLKGSVGHTLGAAGAIESLAALAAMERGVAPASAGDGPTERGLVVLDRAERRSLETTLKLSSAFGGANAALVLRTAVATERAARSPVDVFVSRAVRVTPADADAERLAERTGYSIDRLTRADDLVRLAISATSALEQRVGSLRGAGIVVGHGLATLETNHRFWRRVRESGATRAEPRRFPYTSPNACAGECGVAFGLTGPAFAVGGGAHGGIEALAAAADLVRGGAAERIVVVAVDELGEAARALGLPGESGAVALLVSSSRLDARLERWSVRLEAVGTSAIPRPAHEPLLPLVASSPSVVRAEVSWGGIASAALSWH